MSDFAPIRTTYASTTPVWARDLLKAETHGVLTSGDLMLVKYTDGLVPSGAVIAQVTSGAGTGLFGPFTPGATNGLQIPIGHQVNESRAKAGGRDLQAVLHAGTVTRRLLPSNSGMTNAVATALTAVTYI